MVNRAFSANVLGNAPIPGALPQASREYCAFGAKQMQFILTFFSPRRQAFSRAACEKAAVARIDFPARTPGRLSAFLHRARRRCVLLRSRNARLRAA